MTIYTIIMSTILYFYTLSSASVHAYMHRKNSKRRTQSGLNVVFLIKNPCMHQSRGYTVALQNRRVKLNLEKTSLHMQAIAA